MGDPMGSQIAHQCTSPIPIFPHYLISTRTHEVDPLDGGRGVDYVCLPACIDHHQETTSLQQLGLPEADDHQSLKKLINRESGNQSRRQKATCGRRPVDAKPMSH